MNAGSERLSGRFSTPPLDICALSPVAWMTPCDNVTVDFRRSGLVDLRAAGRSFAALKEDGSVLSWVPLIREESSMSCRDVAGPLQTERLSRP